MSPLPGRGRQTQPLPDTVEPLPTPPPMEVVEEEPEEELSPVVRHLEDAVAAAEEEGMSAAELIGMLTYYAHNLAQEARESAMRAGRTEEE